MRNAGGKVILLIRLVKHPGIVTHYPCVVKLRYFLYFYFNSTL